MLVELVHVFKHLVRMFVRYRISGSSLLAAMDESSTQDSLGDLDKEQTERSSSDEKTDRSGRGQQPTVDIAEVLRRWTHALQRIHKQSLHLVYYILWTYVSSFWIVYCSQ